MTTILLLGIFMSAVTLFIFAYAVTQGGRMRAAMIGAESAPSDGGYVATAPLTDPDQLSVERKAQLAIAKTLGMQLPHASEYATLIDHKPEAALAKRREEMFLTHQAEWREWDMNSRAQDLTGTSAAQFVNNSRFLGPFKLNIDGCKIVAFDWLLRVKVGKGLFKGMFHTVVTFIPEEKLDIPDFYLRAEKHYTRFRLSRFEKVRTGTQLDFHFITESLLPTRVASLFQSELGFTQLVPFLCERNWTVEWTGDRLAVYCPGHIVPATEIKDFVLSATELLEILRQAPEALDQQFKLKYSLAT